MGDKLVKLVLPKANDKLYDFAIDHFVGPLFELIPKVNHELHNELIKHSFKNLDKLIVKIQL